jgi:hypothetical protein
VGWDWVHLVRRPLIGLLYRMIDDDECGAVGGMRLGKGNRSTQRKPAPVSFWPQQIPHDLTWARTRTAAVGSRRLTAQSCYNYSVFQTLHNDGASVAVTFQSYIQIVPCSNVGLGYWICLKMFIIRWVSQWDCWSYIVKQPTRTSVVIVYSQLWFSYLIPSV